MIAMASTVARTITGVGLLALASIPAMAQPGNAVDQATAPKASSAAMKSSLVVGSLHATTS